MKKILFVICSIILLTSCSQESKERNEALKNEREKIEASIVSLNFSKDSLISVNDSIKKLIVANTVEFGNLESEQRNANLNNIRLATENDIRNLSMQQVQLSRKNDILLTSIKANQNELNKLKNIYIIKVKIHQTTYSLDLEEHIKNKMNDVEFEIPVDKEYYDKISIGSYVTDASFKWGSLMRDGDFSKLKITVVSKYSRKR